MLDQPRVYLGCDTGEAEAGPGRDIELALLPYVSAVNIACGGHAGDADSMREAIRAASQHGCLIGAHPSYPDRDGFGRRDIEVDRRTLESSIREQLSRFAQIAVELDASISMIKAHGALYHAVASDVELGYWYWSVCESVIPLARFVGPFGSPVLVEFRSSGIPVLAEGFCDRAYEMDGTLRHRDETGSMISAPELAAAQAERLVNTSNCQLLCVHSDSEGAIGIARAVRDRLLDRGL
ncbi:MAG: LamB/YcsF family protein [Phycisphaerales bacterium]